MAIANLTYDQAMAVTIALIVKDAKAAQESSAFHAAKILKYAGRRKDIRPSYYKQQTRLSMEAAKTARNQLFQLIGNRDLEDDFLEDYA